jgi:hypothetical protein
MPIRVCTIDGGKIVIMISKWVCDRWRYSAVLRVCTIDGGKIAIIISNFVQLFVTIGYYK